MFNTFPSNNPGTSDLANAKVRSLPMQDGGLTGSGLRQQDMTVYDDDTDAKKQYWGPRFRWESLTSGTLTSTAWEDWLVLDAPGVLEFLAAWVVNAGTDSDDVRLRILLDGVEVLVLENFRVGTSDAGKGFVVVGDTLLNGLTVNLGGGISFDNLAFESECRVQLQAESADVSPVDYKCIYRAHGTT